MQQAAEQVPGLKHGTEMHENNLAIDASPAITKSAIPLPWYPEGLANFRFDVSNDRGGHNMQKSEIILQVAAAGGKITLYGLRTLDSWLFSCDVIDQSAALINEPTIEQRSDIVDSWPAALQLINHYQWHRLLPVVVHEAFRREVFGAVQSRFHLDGRVSVQRISDWETLCNGQDTPDQRAT